MGEIKNHQALANIRQMTQSFSDVMIQPKIKPENFVSNWTCTSLYKKGSFMGRLWQCIHWIAGTYESSLRKTITETAKVANSSIQCELNKQKDVLEQINAPGVLGSFWKKYSVHQMQTGLAEAVRYRTLINTIQWATGGIEDASSNIEEQNVEKAIKKIDTVVKLDNIWKKFVSNVPITLLYRELQSFYSNTQEELEKHRDFLQQTTLGKFPKETAWCGERPRYGKKTKCPEKLLYSPLVAMAREIANHALSREELTKLFEDLMEKPSLPTGQILLDLAAFLKDPTIMSVPSQLPSSVAKAVVNPNWVRRCNLEETVDDNDFFGCRRDWIRKERVFSYPKWSYDPITRIHTYQNSYQSEEYMQKRHIRKFYCFEKKIDGTEAISVREFAQEVSG